MYRNASPGTVLAAVLLIGLTSLAFAQQSEAPADSFTKSRLHDMLHQTEREVKANYYDPTFHGIDIEGNYRKYDALIDKVNSQGEGFRVIAGFLSDFHDSHLFFIPPPRPYRYETGYRAQIIGDNEYVTQVRPGSDAAEKVSPGDRIVHFNGYIVNRASEHSMMSYYHYLAPAVAVQLDLSSPEGKSSKVVVNSKLVPRKLVVSDASDIDEIIRDEEGDMKLEHDRTVEIGDVMIWKMSEFGDNQVDAIIKRANHHKALIVDLRGNPGGAVDTLKSIVGHLFDHDVKLFDEVSRKQTKTITAKSFGDRAFTGKLIVLVDSHSASCSELMSRVVQLEHRGTIVGDLSAGAVMESRQYPEEVGGDFKAYYALSITMANVLMSDGKSVEKVGVMPDERILPSGDDLYNQRDPVLARAIVLAGGQIDPTAAGKLFPFQWPSM
jgi:C-terminal processing protease CtpA/Prc